MVEASPDATHFAFEPIPRLAAHLRDVFPNVTVLEVALADAPGTLTFQHVVSNEAYSGLRRREYPRADEEIEEITVEVTTLDAVVGDSAVAFVKIDVEGAELGVLRGATQVLTRCRPVVVFEHGLGAADFYGTNPGQVFDLLRGCGLRIGLLEGYEQRNPLSRAAFVRELGKRRNFYFVSFP